MYIEIRTCIYIYTLHYVCVYIYILIHTYVNKVINMCIYIRIYIHVGTLMQGLLILGIRDERSHMQTTFSTYTIRMVDTSQD